MALPFWAMAALAGAAKSEFMDRPEAEKKRKMEDVTLLYSPWTGRQPNYSGIKDPNTLGSAVQWGLAGASMQQANPSMFGSLGGSSAAPVAGSAAGDAVAKEAAAGLSQNAIGAVSPKASNTTFGPLASNAPSAAAPSLAPSGGSIARIPVQSKFQTMASDTASQVDREAIEEYFARQRAMDSSGMSLPAYRRGGYYGQ